MKKTILTFGGFAVVIMLLFQLEKWSLFSMSGSKDMYVLVTGILFLITGIVMSRYFSVRKNQRQKELRKSSLTVQETKVLHLISEGLSNKEIAKHLFIAETTVKTHVSRILEKLDARRRTEAVRIAQELDIL